jgi:hypothetical protein
MVLLSTFAIVAYKCKFLDGFKLSPDAYFFHLFYFRSRHCDPFVDWSLVGINNVENVTQIMEMPYENSMVTRTFYVTAVQLGINSFLIVVSLIALLATIYNVYYISSKITYWTIFVPYVFIFHIAIVIDFVTATYFADDRLRSFVSKINIFYIKFSFRIHQ